MEGDIMHDAIRRDVLGAILAGKNNDFEGVSQKLSKTLQSIMKILTTTLQAIKKNSCQILYMTFLPKR